MTEMVTVRGFVATDPQLRTIGTDTRVASFRVAATSRRYDRQAQTWVEVGTNWFSVSAFRDLGENVVASIHKGDPVLVTGRLRVRDYERKDGTSGTDVGIDAETLGHDLVFGAAAFRRMLRPPVMEEPADPDNGPDNGPDGDGEGHGRDADEERVDDLTGELGGGGINPLIAAA